MLQYLEAFPIYRQTDWQADDTTSASLIFAFAVIFASAVFVFEYYLDIRQYFKFVTASGIPKELNHPLISEDLFKKALSYGKDKSSFGLAESLIMFIEGISLIFAGYLPFVWDGAGSIATYLGLISPNNSMQYVEIVTTVAFVFLLTLHDTFISLPFSLYRTFVIEQKHGFNKSTLLLFIRDKLLSLTLTLVIGAPVLSLMIFIVRWGGQYFYFYVWVFLFLISLLLMAVYPTLIAPLFNEYTKLDQGELYEAVEALAKRVSFPLTNIFLVDGSKRSAHSNAYFYGFFKNKRIVLFDTLIKQVTQEELLAILGHEIGHWALSHTMQGFVITQLYIFTLFLAFSTVQNTPALFSAFGFAYNEPMPVFVGLMLFTQTFWQPVDKSLQLIMNFNSRANEFAADRYAAQLGMGEALCEGLVKISVENLGNMVPDTLYSLYHFSHPPLVERLRAVRQIKADVAGTSKKTE